MPQTIAIPARSLQLLNTMQREIGEASQLLDRAKARSLAVQVAFAEMLGIAPGSVVDLDLPNGCFVVSDAVQDTVQQDNSTGAIP